MTVNDRFALMSAYLKARAKAEGVAYGLSPAIFQVCFQEEDIRAFFGCQTDEQGNIIYDTQEPTPGFLAGFLNRSDLPTLIAAEPETSRTSLARAQRLYQKLPMTTRISSTEENHK